MQPLPATPPAQPTTNVPSLAITRNGAQPTSKGSEQSFTGAVRLERLFQPGGTLRTSGANVTFEPGARTAWHAHPMGQILIVTAGKGWVQEDGGERQDINPGDAIWIPPGVKHWHGASATSAMTHISFTEHVNGSNVVWMEHVSDAQYQG